MDPLLIVSPHMDDAVLSAGQFMAGRPDITVATVFTGIPKRQRTLTTYDKNCGFTSARHAIEVRKRENFKALLATDAQTPVYFDLLDSQYEPRTTPDKFVETADAITSLLLHLNTELRPQQVVGPVGIKHPDHQVCAVAFSNFLLAAPEVEGWLYEDLPGRVLYPIETMQQLQGWAIRFPDMTEDFIGTGDRATKKAAVECYGSQLWALDEPTYLVPERFWRLNGPTT